MSPSNLPGQPGPKPQMSQREANWHAHLAGMRATQQAEQLGTTPEAAHALLNAACGGRAIAGLKFPPIHGGFLLMLTLVGELKQKLTALSSESGSLMAISYCLGMPDQAWAAMQEDDAGKQFQADVFKFAQQIPLAELKTLGAWVSDQLAALNSGAKPEEEEDEAEKKSPTDPEPHAEPTTPN